LPGTLSGGQRQRVAVARALANRPVMLLADEPTGALDSKTGHEVLELFSELHRQGNTILIVTHDLEIASLANRQVEIHDGRIASSTEKVA
jgi:putative ABC transport system ATP-binding protein